MDARNSSSGSNWVAALFGSIGRAAIGATGTLGTAAIFVVTGSTRFFSPPWRVRSVIEQISFIGSKSVGIILLTSAFTGMVLALQGYNALVDFDAEQKVGSLVVLSLVRELGPVLTALMLTARAGSAIAATLGNMRVGAQIDALETMGIDPVSFLVTPRVAAGMIAGPILTAFFIVAGFGFAYLFGTSMLQLEGALFLNDARSAVAPDDVLSGFVKSLVFSFLIVWIATWRGFGAGEGAKGVGTATTRAVVDASVLVLVVNYALTALMFEQ